MGQRYTKLDLTKKVSENIIDNKINEKIKNSYENGYNSVLSKFNKETEINNKNNSNTCFSENNAQNEKYTSMNYVSDLKKKCFSFKNQFENYKFNYGFDNQKLIKCFKNFSKSLKFYIEDVAIHNITLKKSISQKTISKLNSRSIQVLNSLDFFSLDFYSYKKLEKVLPYKKF